MKLLVAYASRYGSTAEMAEVIGKQLRKRGREVDVKAVDNVGSLADYDGFVIGSAVYAGNWMRPAVDFLRANAELLAGSPTWFFSSGPTGQGDPNEIMGGWTFPEDLADMLEKIKPEDVILFHGKIDPDNLSQTERMLLKSVKATVGDYRDWLVVHGWAGRVDMDLKEMAASSS